MASWSASKDHDRVPVNQADQVYAYFKKMGAKVLVSHNRNDIDSKAMGTFRTDDSVWWQCKSYLTLWFADGTVKYTNLPFLIEEIFTGTPR